VGALLAESRTALVY